MNGGVSNSDIDIDLDDLDDSGTGSGSDISIATDGSSLEGEFEENMALNDASDGSVYESRLRGNTEDSYDFGPPIVVPLKTGSDRSGDSEPIDSGSGSSRGSRRRSGSFSRRPPVRTKSGEGINSSTHSAASGRRRPPPRTKSGTVIKEEEEDGEGNIRRMPPRRTKSGSSHGMRRKPPQRTKSGGTLRSDESADDESEDFVTDMPDDGGFEDASPTSPARRRKNNVYRDKALATNMARRQKSSDMLGAMREATRKVPARAKSEMGGITNGRRRGTGRTKSGDPTKDAMTSLASPGRKPLRRRAPPRTKSGSGCQIASPPLEA